MKRQSICRQFTVIFVCMTAFVIIAVWCINNWALEDYYMDYKVKVLEQAYTEIDQIIKREMQTGESALEGVDAVLNKDAHTANDNAEELASVVQELRDTSNIMILIYDSISNQTLLSSARDIEILRERVQRYILGQGTDNQEVLVRSDNYMIQKSFDPNTKTSFLESWGFFSDNGTIYIMSTPLESIKESVEISNHFLMYVGLAAIAVSAVLLYFITKKMTDPIQKLSILSEQLSNLDFEARYEDTPHTTQELSCLGQSMNVLSNKLKDTIAELKTANNELQKDIQEKIQVDEMRKDFIANVSHELKTPIALIQGYAEGLTEGMAEEKESRDYYCNVIMDEAGKMNKMVKQLLTLTALEFGNEQLSMERFNLTELIGGVISASGILLEQNEIEVEFDSSKAIYVWADEFKIEEVITNYLSNAIHHAGGEKKIVVKMLYQGDRVKVSVFNTGNPILEEAVQNLWTKFYKVDKARTRAYGGSGIGLSIVKAIMEMHHQSYGVTNWDNGVEFWFTLGCSNISV